ncbi:uncharacterized protein LOC130943378 isoform X2 [Arachis stenosperma]|uniref:uncharacterized protein LOC130943378 isoform X2 n=1 Tax=Arachis stenosperma TaxID=217475 RepID=UPI0025AC1851|nr:uncharacterized protein LOC130943378 isoform X2 [Arachis stenosperma]
MAFTISFPMFRFLLTPSASSISTSTAIRVPHLHAPTLSTRPTLLSSNSMSQPLADSQTIANQTESPSENADVVLQYVVLRRDLIDTWPLGSVVTQGCHASVSAVWSNKDDPLTIDYCSPEKIDSMHKVHKYEGMLLVYPTALRNSHKTLIFSLDNTLLCPP